VAAFAPRPEFKRVRGKKTRRAAVKAFLKDRVKDLPGKRVSAQMSLMHIVIQRARLTAF
jgi:hypothetical protein